MKHCPVKVVSGKCACDSCPFWDAKSIKPHGVRREVHCATMGFVGPRIGLDHEEERPKRGKYAYFPYSMTYKEVKNLIKLCDAFGFCFEISHGGEYNEQALKVTITGGDTK